MVTVPYVKGLSETFTRILKAYRITTAVKPHTTLRNMLVHPKDQIDNEENSEMIYKISCKNCDRVYIRKTGKPLGIGVKQHQQEVDNITAVFTRAERQERQTSATNLLSWIMSAVRIM